MRTEIQGLVGQEVGVEFTVEKKGMGGKVRCIKFVKVMVVENHKLVQVCEIHHVWIQSDCLSSYSEGQVLRAVGTVLEYTKKGNVRDYTVQKLRGVRVVR